jgi:hypothetical protein
MQQMFRSKNLQQHVINHRLDCAMALMQCNRQAQAIIEYDAVMKLDPNDSWARWHRALALLSIGDYVRGMPEHEWAWKIFDWRVNVVGDTDNLLKLPLWQGAECNLLAYHNEGYGDAIMYLRFLPALVKRCKTVTLVVRPELVSLMEGHGATVLGEVPQDCSKFDSRVTMFNSIWMMGCVTPLTIPSKPYIPAEFTFGGKKKKMGIAWSGNTQKNFTLNRFLMYLDVYGFELFSLQKTTRDTPGVHRLEAVDFKATARLMEKLDVIVTVDTAVAHMAGAMGHPNAHVMIPFYRDWRWWNKDWWYPTLNIYPQDNAADWDKPFDQLNEVIAGLRSTEGE